MNIKKSILLRVRISFLLICLFAGAIFYRLIFIQYVEKDIWIKLAEEIGLQYRVVKATRGNIYSDNGSLLATSLPFYRVALDPSIASTQVFSEGIDSLSNLLSRFYGDRESTYYKRKIINARESGKQYLVLNRTQINYLDKKQLSEWPILREGRFKGGVIFEKIDKRYLPFSQLGSRTIGFLNSEDRGLVGLEYSFNDVLAGQDGKALFEKMVGGNWKPVYDGTEVKSVEGLDIQTTLDINLQDVTESALFNHLKKHDADYGCVIIMEVATGEIKAMSNLSKNRNGEYRERYNYSVAGLTEPGSTFKLASMIALFEDTELELEDSIETGEGEYEYYDRIMRDHKPGGYGRLTVKDAFAKSSNIGISMLVNQHFGVNPQKFIDYIQSFGLSEPTGFQMIGEGVPYIKNPSQNTWSGTTLPWMSIGYELKLTPLQTLTFYNAIANNGTMIRPIIVKDVKRADRLKNSYNTTVLNKKICSEKTLVKVKSMLEEVVHSGTASNISDADYKIAGKTGTARKVENGRYVRKYYTSFAGYFPADNPKYSCIVIIDNPKGYRQYGSDVAAPVFKEVADKIYSMDLEMHTEYPKEYAIKRGVFPVIRAGYYEDLNLICNNLGISNHIEEDQEWVRASIDQNSIEWKNNLDDENIIPDVTGMTLRDALYILENKGLKVDIDGKGRVTEQQPLAGSKMAKGSKINIKLG